MASPRRGPLSQDRGSERVSHVNIRERAQRGQEGDEDQKGHKSENGGEGDRTGCRGSQRGGPWEGVWLLL